eukprot:3121770-Rhodomonas_salina.2
MSATTATSSSLCCPSSRIPDRTRTSLSTPLKVPGGESATITSELSSSPDSSVPTPTSTLGSQRPSLVPGAVCPPPHVLVRAVLPLLLGGSAELRALLGTDALLSALLSLLAPPPSSAPPAPCPSPAVLLALPTCTSPPSLSFSAWLAAGLISLLSAFPPRDCGAGMLLLSLLSARPDPCCCVRGVPALASGAPGLAGTAAAATSSPASTSAPAAATGAGAAGTAATAPPWPWPFWADIWAS